MSGVRDSALPPLRFAAAAAPLLALLAGSSAFGASSPSASSRAVSTPSRPVERPKVESPRPKVKSTTTTPSEETEQQRPVELADDVPSTTSRGRHRRRRTAARIEHHTLETSLVGSNGSYGTMFDVYPVASVPELGPSPIRVASLDVHVGIVDPECLVTVYTRVGTHLGHETDPSAWVKIIDDERVSCAGRGALTVVPPELFGDDPLDIGEEGRAFYVSMDVPYLRYDGVDDRDGFGFGGGGSWTASDDVLGVRNGSGLGGPFRDVRQPRAWNGAVHYSYERPSSEEASTTPDSAAADDEDGGGAQFSEVAAGTNERNQAVSLVHGSDVGPAGFLAAGGGCESELTTTYDDNTGSYGNMFTVRTKGNNVVIHGMDIYTDVPGRVDFEIYTKVGSYEDGLGNGLDEWTLLSKGSVAGAGLLHVGAPIPEEGFQDVAVGAYSRQSFYLTLSTPDIRYRNTTDEGLDVGDVHTSNPDMDVLVGHGVAVYPLDVNAVNAFYTPRAWAGTFRYTSEASCPTAAPSDPPTTVPTRAPVVPPPTPECTLDSALSTPMLGGTGAYGNMFDVKPSVDLTITALEFYTDLRGQVVHAEVYGKRGSYRGHERTPSSWNLIAKATVRATGPDRGTLIPDEAFADIAVQADEVRAFYVTLNTTDVRYTFGSEVSSTYASNDDLEILEGNGVVTYPFGTSDKSFYEPRRWNGAVRYRVGVPCPTRSPTEAPTTLPPTSNPTGSPTLADDVETDVTFTFFVEHLRQVDAETVLDTVSESVEDQLMDILLNDEGAVGTYRKEHGLAVSDVISKKGVVKEGECVPQDSGNVCTAVDTSVTLTHRPSVLSGGVIYNLLKYSDQLTETLDKENNRFVTTYEGDRAVETKVVITVAGVPGFMGERETQYFEQVVNSFLQGVLNPDDSREVEGGQKKEEEEEEKKPTKKIGMDVIPVTVLTVDAQHQKIQQETTQQGRAASGRRTTRRRRRRRHLQVTVGGGTPPVAAGGEIDDSDRLYYVDVTTRIGGEYKLPPDVSKEDFDEDAAEEEFDRKVSEAIEGFSRRLVVDIKSHDKNGVAGGGGADGDGGAGGGAGGGGGDGKADDGGGKAGTANDLEEFFGQVEDVFVNKVITGSPTAFPTGSPVAGGGEQQPPADEAPSPSSSSSAATTVAPVVAPSAPVAAPVDGPSAVPQDEDDGGPEPPLPEAAAEEEEQEAPKEHHEPTFMESFLGIAVIAAGCSLILCTLTACLAHRRRRKNQRRRNGGGKGSLRRLEYDGIDDDIDDMYRRETFAGHLGGMKRLDGGCVGVDGEEEDGPPCRYRPDLTIGAPPRDENDEDEEDGWRDNTLDERGDAEMAASSDWRKGAGRGAAAAAAGTTTGSSTASSSCGGEDCRRSLSNRSRESFHDEDERMGFDEEGDGRGYATTPMMPQEGRRRSSGGTEGFRYDEPAGQEQRRGSSVERRRSSGEREGFRYDEPAGRRRSSAGSHAVVRDAKLVQEGGRPTTSRRASSAASSNPDDEMEEILRRDRAAATQSYSNHAAEVTIGRQQGPPLSRSLPPKTHQDVDELIVRDIERRRRSMDAVELDRDEPSRDVAANIARRRSSIGPTSTTTAPRRRSSEEGTGPSIGLERKTSSREQRYGSSTGQQQARRVGRDGHDPQRPSLGRARSGSFRRASVNRAGQTVCSDPNESQRRLTVDDAMEYANHNASSSRSLESGRRPRRRHSLGYDAENSRSAVAMASYEHAERVRHGAPDARRSSLY